MYPVRFDILLISRGTMDAYDSCWNINDVSTQAVRNSPFAITIIWTIKAREYTDTFLIKNPLDPKFQRKLVHDHQINSYTIECTLAYYILFVHNTN